MDITKQIIQNPSGGFSLLSGDGAPNFGCLVGGQVSPLTVDTSVSMTLAQYAETVESIQFFLVYLKNTVGAPFVLWWTDEESDLLYIDGVTWHRGEAEAILTARERRQLDYFDCHTRSTVFLEV